MMSSRKTNPILRSVTNVLLTQRDNVLVAQFREFTKHLSRVLLSLSTSKTLADAYSYTLDPHVDKNGNDISTKSMRLAKRLPATYVMQYIKRLTYTYYPPRNDPR